MLETKNYESGRVRLIGQISTQRTLLLQNKLRQSLHLSKVDQKERWFRTPTTNKLRQISTHMLPTFEANLFFACAGPRLLAVGDRLHLLRRKYGTYLEQYVETRYRKRNEI
uniref:Uncharacterized protein n=1 Tax=Rhizophora mucronata TaxID=61149 RepID=A0A2P2MPH8_RHIMU